MYQLSGEFAIAILGLVMLLVAGDALVRGAVNLSFRLGVPALLVSLTIVAFGTSAPELLIVVQSILKGVPGLAIGNIVGSNTANVLLVLGLPALLAGLSASRADTRKSYTIMIASTLLFIVVAFFQPITWWHALILLAALTLVLGETFLDARRHKVSSKNEVLERVDATMSGKRVAFLLIVGFVGLPIGAKLLIDSSVIIAGSFGVSDTVIGLTLVAMGTSLPELATTVIAAYRGKADVAIGNVIGSNLFNLLAIVGIAGLVGDIPVPAQFLTMDLWVMLGASLLIAPVVYGNKRMGWRWGGGLTGAYVVYIIVVFNSGA